ncbi:myosin regulatory light chain LC-2, mantle muscle-like isoform X2 [Watersipora subatra]|uniref:myosin regulatory light chain LC-2, mantle muscle-like isoform X2 n=1 Tax=Watersipora subatra TaxID=2589382 RepID=UPI00355B4D1A
MAEEKKRMHRATTNVLGMFSQSQLQEFKEAFSMIDADRDGFIGIEDLREIHLSLGRQPSDEELNKMLSECPGQLNFTSFLTLFGEKMHGTDPENTLRQAFEQFDPARVGKLPEEYIKDLLQNMGDNFKEDEIRQVWKEAPISGGVFDYDAFVTLIKRGNQEELAA